MNVHSLSENESKYVSFLAERLVHIGRELNELKKRHWYEVHEPSGFFVAELVSFLDDAANRTTKALDEALS